MHIEVKAKDKAGKDVTRCFFITDVQLIPSARECHVKLEPFDSVAAFEASQAEKSAASEEVAQLGADKTPAHDTNSKAGAKGWRTLGDYPSGGDVEEWAYGSLVSSFDGGEIVA